MRPLFDWGTRSWLLTLAGWSAFHPCYAPYSWAHRWSVALPQGVWSMCSISPYAAHWAMGISRNWLYCEIVSLGHTIIFHTLILLITGAVEYVQLACIREQGTQIKISIILVLAHYIILDCIAIKLAILIDAWQHAIYAHTLYAHRVVSCYINRVCITASPLEPWAPHVFVILSRHEYIHIERPDCTAAIFVQQHSELGIVSDGAPPRVAVGNGVREVVAVQVCLVGAFDDDVWADWCLI